MDIRTAVVAWIGIAALSGGCDRTAPTLAERARDLGGSCVVIVIDAAAAGHLPTYGYDRDTTPNLDRLAGSSFVFDRAYSQAPMTVMSVPSYLTSLSPHSIALRREAKTASTLVYLPQAFAAAGFRTAGFTENPVVSMSFPGHEAFELWGGRLGGRRGAELTSPDLVERALAWVDDAGEDRFFLYLHLLPPHAPYLPPEEHVRFRPPDYTGSLVPTTSVVGAIDRGRREATPEDVAFLVSQYDANLHYADAMIARLLDGLASRERLDDAVVVVTSDHGEAFGQHGRFGHTSTLYDEMLRVPLVVRLPEALGVEPRRIEERVPLLDLAPTLAELFGLGDALGAQAEGRSWLPVFESTDATHPERLVFAQRNRQVAAIRGDYKIILTDEDGELRQEIYRLSDDPGERENLAGSPDVPLAELRAAVIGFLDGRVEQIGLEATAATLSAETRLQLEALGYLGDTESPKPRPRYVPD